MAEGFARRDAADVIEASSAGLSATHSIARDTIDAMAERGVDINSHFPKDFDPGLAAHYDVIVNMSGFELPPVPGPVVVEWPVRDPFCEEMSIHRNVRDEIEARVYGLAEDLRKHGTVTETASVGQRIAPEVLRRPRLWQRFTRWL